MFGVTGKRTLLSHSKHLALATPAARARIAAQPHVAGTRDFHASPRNAVTRPTWMPMRVKTPWIDALTASREAARKVKDGEPPAQIVKPDLAPKRMSDSYYSAVCIC